MGSRLCVREGRWGRCCGAAVPESDESTPGLPSATSASSWAGHSKWTQWKTCGEIRLSSASNHIKGGSLRRKLATSFAVLWVPTIRMKEAG